MVVLTEEQHQSLDASCVTTMRVYVTAAAKRAVVVKEDDLLTKADIQANPVQVSKAFQNLVRQQMLQDARHQQRVEHHDLQVCIQMEICEGR